VVDDLVNNRQNRKDGTAPPPDRSAPAAVLPGRAERPDAGMAQPAPDAKREGGFFRRLFGD
jgi:hypothetical protein